MAAESLAYGSSWAKDLITATATTMPDSLTHCPQLGIETMPPQQPEALQSES